jgi:hypothetical protein
LMRIRDEKIRIRDKHPGSTTLSLSNLFDVLQLLLLLPPRCPRRRRRRR